jgi:NhaA family Na+:H+ antiporter
MSKDDLSIQTVSPTRITAVLKDFFRLEASGGIVLVIASALALIIANSNFYDFYHYIFNEVQFRIGFSDIHNYDLLLKKSILLWINDGLMAVFFFLVGMEIKRELMEGELSSRTRALLPALAAVGGMVVPAAIFWYINQDDPAAIKGWAIPAATDIAFALGVLSLVGSRAPVSLKILLTAIAIIDDLGAILIIAIFYSEQVNMGPLAFAGAALIVMAMFNRGNVIGTFPYIFIGMILWVAVLKSGIHATLAGVITAFFIPLKDPNHPEHSPLKHLEHALHPWVAFGVLPIFAFANAGVPFSGMSFKDLYEDLVTLGIILGLFFGKQLGIFTILFLTIKSGLSPKPNNANWWQLYAVSCLCGIGFTMSLFIGGLAYTGIEMQASVRLGVLVGSILSAALGFAILKYGPTKLRDHPQVTKKKQERKNKKQQRKKKKSTASKEKAA